MKVFINKSKTEEDLIAGCIKQKASAQQALFDKYSGKMLGLCRRYVKDVLEAEGVMITAFTKIFERIGQYTGEGNFEGWMKRIMVNESLQYLRKHKNMQLNMDIEEAHHLPNLDAMEDHLQTEDLMQMIAELPVGYRTVFNLYAIEGFSHKEIAEQLKINENTSKSQLSRARVYLQKRLAEMEQEIAISHGNS
ncbi:DNA-directed RNA polymerase sigma-70 factor [Marivirga tractuosa]|uniref:RNA polymerase, sigma-24 subunit, ECF subfamily n=1 Tax=Marivirga tractuosa (strain ATCC 23168 / DSM 4126 / NBRC 15989 / NCIMB 1408 / VKM B-1430 / H-43) TaxID=643867 RepID=E4TM65_MARTH|nr:sigma-70 family RNA polymerase sigma factor [Marivirga tractuosa]ADR21341.1 RNA polymerase, sigma-24 subunit, ECF subfamily [Marivirga tractuosa DSM 4126]BDD14205.1 DNA-directed RNA polymerase sigma-70 factor [Marivirga tractuosa]